jgi:anti-anti-sigma factor
MGIETADTAPIRTEIGNEEGVPVVTIEGELDLSTVDAVRRVLTPVVDSEPERIVLDLRGLEFMDSSGIALMLSVANRVPTVELRHPSDIIRQVIQITGLTEALQIVE